MPIEKTPVEYYQSYCASQRRVEQWVSDTGQHLEQPQGGPSQQPEWKGFLEDPGLITPISMATPLDKGKSRETDSQPPDITDRLTGSEKTKSSLRIPGALAVSSASDAQSRLQPLPTSSSSKRTLDNDTIKEGQSSILEVPTASHSRTQESKKIRSYPPEDILDDLTLPRSSSKHSKESKHTRRTLETSKSKQSLSSSSRKHREREREKERDRDRERVRDPSRSHTHRTRSRSRKHRDDSLDLADWAPILAYVPYGIIPLLFAMTTGSTSLSLAAAAIMLAGYFCVDYAKNNSTERSSRR
ncbi:hypothetical protein CPB83DRAFT_861296 [Crepidotus variabilis]|uniref:Uncharacterized protein n=1 Tax=Crepidotus variabilis TaxID=179855 RepID=A0A9P6E8L8_9AGAR|nr:hypothetical protein CPB83DRAFT_861296 [Crepidotus variabilis]